MNRIGKRLYSQTVFRVNKNKLTARESICFVTKLMSYGFSDPVLLKEIGSLKLFKTVGRANARRHCWLTFPLNTVDIWDLFLPFSISFLLQTLDCITIKRSETAIFFFFRLTAIILKGH